MELAPLERMAVPSIHGKISGNIFEAGVECERNDHFSQMMALIFKGRRRGRRRYRFRDAAFETLVVVLTT
jgi:hypothetical protein